MDSTVFHLFSAPIYYVPDTNFRISNNLLNIILDKNKFPDYKSSSLSEDAFILNQPEFKDVKRVLEYHLQIYTKQICGIDNEIYITNSWLSRQELNDFHHKHVHKNSIFSGCLYLKSSPKSELIFSGENHFSRQWPLTITYNHVNLINTENHAVQVDTGCCVMFPSNVLHGGTPSPLDTTRVAVCFNSFIRGNMAKPGNYGEDLKFE